MIPKSARRHVSVRFLVSQLCFCWNACATKEEFYQDPENGGDCADRQPSGNTREPLGLMPSAEEEQSK